MFALPNERAIKKLSPVATVRSGNAYRARRNRLYVKSGFPTRLVDGLTQFLHALQDSWAHAADLIGVDGIQAFRLYRLHAGPLTPCA